MDCFAPELLDRTCSLASMRGVRLRVERCEAASARGGRGSRGSAEACEVLYAGAI
jgi:hypothetical protein